MPQTDRPSTRYKIFHWPIFIPFQMTARSMTLFPWPSTLSAKIPATWCLKNQIGLHVGASKINSRPGTCKILYKLILYALMRFIWISRTESLYLGSFFKMVLSNMKLNFQSININAVVVSYIQYMAYVIFICTHSKGKIIKYYILGSASLASCLNISEVSALVSLNFPMPLVTLWRY